MEDSPYLICSVDGESEAVAQTTVVPFCCVDAWSVLNEPAIC